MSRSGSPATLGVDRRSALHQRACGCMACHDLDGDKLLPPFLDIAGFDAVAGGPSTTFTLAPGGSVRGTIDTASDSDWYRIQLVANEQYIFTVPRIPGGIGNSILRLRDADGTAVATNDDANLAGGLLYSEIRFTAPAGGTYFLDVGGMNGSAGTYVLSASQPVNDAALGNTLTTASLEIGAAPITAALDATGDRDWYRVTLTAGQRYEFVTSAVAGSSAVDTTLTLRDAAGNVLAYNDDSPGRFSQIRFVAPVSGTYFIDVGGFGEAQTGNYQLSAVAVPPLAEFTLDQIATQLLQGYFNDGGPPHRFNVREGGTITVDITSLTAEGQFLARETLLLWGDVLGITFTEVASDAQITFKDDEPGGRAFFWRQEDYFITSAIVNVGLDVIAQNGTSLNGGSFLTYLHEVGHALGLGHSGNYDIFATFEQDALFLNDSWATTVMSYFDQTRNPLFAGRGFTFAFPATPMPADIVALQRAYYSATTTRTGDTIYGVGNNTGRAVFGTDAAIRTPAGALPAVTIVDHGGNDTLDYSTFAASQLINLNAETYSNVGGGIGNLSIARGTVIENAVGGSGNDTLTGNAVANVLTGGRGNDTINGGSNIDIAIVRGLRSAYSITQTSTGVFRVVGADGTDRLSGIEFLRFDDQTIRLLPGTGVTVNFNTADRSVYQSALNAIRDFDGNALGGNGSWLRIGQADVNGDGDIDQILVNNAIGRFATVGTAPDGLVYFSDYSWAGETRVAGIYIDPLVAAGIVERFGPNDSQRRFQNDLQIENINRVLGANDYDRDGLQEVYLALTDGTAYLRAIMESDGNIRYANYQSQQEVIDYLTANGFGPDTWAGWFTRSGSGEAGLGGEDGSGIGRAGLSGLLVAEDIALPGALALNPQALQLFQPDAVTAEFYG